MGDENNASATRLKSYKNKGMDQSELRRRREEEGIQLRKQKRDEQVFNRPTVTVIARRTGVSTCSLDFSVV